MEKFLKSIAWFGALIALFFVLYSFRVSLAFSLSRAGESLRDFARGSDEARELLVLKSENQILRDELSRTTRESALIAEERYRYKTAEIYSRYPFNDQSAVFINLGSIDGIQEGMPVFVEKGILLGKVKRTHRTQSEIETIFSPQWRSSVSLGDEKIKAAYLGGSVPMLDLIQKDASIASGDKVVSVSPDVPLGTLLGTIDEVEEGTYDVWQRAKVKPLFSPESFFTVLVLVDFP